MSQELIARIEVAAEGGALLNAEIAVATRSGLPSRCEWALKFPNWEAEHTGRVRIIGNVNGNGDYIAGRFTAPNYSTSIDAALTLVPKGHDKWAISGRNAAVVQSSNKEVTHADWTYAATPALALCAAALKARLV